MSTDLSEATTYIKGRAASAKPRPPIALQPPTVHEPGGGEHLDVDETLRQLHAGLVAITKQITLTPEQVEQLRDSSANLTSADAFEKKVARAQRWGGWIWAIVSIAGVLFSTGVAWSVFMGANATDDEVAAAISKEAIRHNGGTHPATIDEKTARPVGDHPDMRAAITENTRAVSEVKGSVQKIEQSQKKLDKRSEYQFELGRWQSEIEEAKRRHARPPAKPKALKDLEKSLMLGDYE